MGVTFDIIGSILVRTAIVLIVLRMNISLNTMVSESTAHTTIQQELSILRDVMSSDFESAALNVVPSSATFLETQSDRVKFQGDLGADGSVETIYYYTGSTSELSNTPNPNDRKLYRQIGGGTPMIVAHGITKCTFAFYTVSGSPTWSPPLVKSFSITLILEEGRFSTQVKKVVGGVETYVDKYPASYWEQTFFPSNL